MRKRIFFKRALLAVVGALICVSCAEDSAVANQTIFPDSVDLHPGDLAFRCGGSLDSHAVLIADNGGDFSHVGIVVDNDGKKMIVHAVPDEPEFEGDVDRVKMETPQKFFIRKNAVYGQIRRFADSAIADRASKVALNVFRRGTLFDSEFNISDTTRMYCTELIIFAYERAGAPIEIKPRHKASWMDYESIMPSDIVDTGKFKTIVSF